MYSPFEDLRDSAWWDYIGGLCSPRVRRMQGQGWTGVLWRYAYLHNQPSAGMGRPTPASSANLWHKPGWLNGRAIVIGYLSSREEMGTMGVGTRRCGWVEASTSAGLSYISNPI